MKAIPMQFHNADMQIRDEPTVMQSVRARAKYTSEGEVCKTLKDDQRGSNVRGPIRTALITEGPL
jgi:hypothetical protein